MDRSVYLFVYVYSYTGGIYAVNVQVWPEVKQANPERSVCELGSMIGRMWREMTDADKQPYFDSFTQAKVKVSPSFHALLIDQIVV